MWFSFYVPYSFSPSLFQSYYYCTICLYFHPELHSELHILTKLWTQGKTNFLHDTMQVTYRRAFRKSLVFWLLWGERLNARGKISQQKSTRGRAGELQVSQYYETSSSISMGIFLMLGWSTVLSTVFTATVTDTPTSMYMAYTASWHSSETGKLSFFLLPFSSIFWRDNHLLGLFQY